MGLIVLTVLSSCKKDDNSTSNPSIVGTWAEKPSTDQFTLIFNSNGTGSYQIKDCINNYIHETGSFTYVFNSTTNLIAFSGDITLSIGYLPYLNNTSFKMYRDAAFTKPFAGEFFRQ